jgi:hypothetical protein
VRLHRLRPKTHAKAAEALQLVLELPLGLRSEVRAQIVDALSSYSPDCWSFIMIGREKSRILLQLIVAGPRPGTTLAVWEAARLSARFGTGEIEASTAELAELSGTTSGEVTRALSRLVEIGGLVRLARGRYALHPAAAWSGSQNSREKAKLELVE